MALARFLWSQASTIARVLRYLPAISTSPEPTPDEIAQFTPAEADSINKGVFNPDGSRIPPNFDHHVDDCLYVDVAKTLKQTIASSVLALYLILGFPDASKGIRDCVSWEKFTTTFSHRRHCLGWSIDSRALTVSLPSEKRDRIIQRLRTFLRKHRLTLQEIAELLGLLSNATTVCRHMRCSYFNLQRLLRMILVHWYRTLIGYHRRKDWELQIASRLSSTFIHRMDGILSRNMAKVLWGSKQSYKLGPAAIREVKAIIHSLRTEEWKIFIPQMIPHDHHFESFGDASFLGGGAYPTSLDYWFRVVWSKQIVAGTKLKPSDASYIHINVLECLVSFLQAVALVVTIESSALSAPIRDLFPNGIPAFPVLRCCTDNTATVSWINDTRTTSLLAQALVALYDITAVSLDERLAQFPAQCRTHLRSQIRAVMQLESSPIKSTRVLGTIRSHRIHFLRFLRRLNWPPMDLLLESVSHDARTHLLAAFAVDLAVGNTVKGKPIKAATIGNYLRDTATLLENFCGRDPRYTNRSDNDLALPIRAVLNECKRHENMPHRVDPYTIEMHTTLVALNAATTAHMDGLHSAMEDWFNLSTYLGFRLREWAQEDDYRRLASGGEIAPNGTTRAFTLDDIRLFDSGNRPVPIAEFLIENFDAVARSNVKFSWQKNHDHGEEKLLSSNPRNPSRDALRSLHNIVSRFARIVGLDKTDIPLAVYKGSFGEKFFIHSKVIASTLWTLAKKTYNLTDRDLQRHYKYTSHSL